MSLLALIVVFAVAAAFVMASGVLLARSGDEIARRTGLGGLLVGSVFVALATSMPEIATTVSAAAGGAPDLAVGNVLGSSMANMAILAIVDLVGRGTVWPSVEVGHARLAALAMALTTVALMGILYPMPAIGWVGIDTIAMVAMYALTMMWIRRGTTAPESPPAAAPVPTGWGEESPAPSLRTELLRFGLATAVILVAAPIATIAADGIAREAEISETFVGAFLLAVTTSLPELVASIAAVRIGAYDLAVGNLFGSNTFNMTILIAADLFYTPGPILAAVSSAQVLAGLGAILLMAVAVAVIVHRERTSIARLEPDAIVVLVLYALMVAAVWTVGG